MEVLISRAVVRTLATVALLLASSGVWSAAPVAQKPTDATLTDRIEYRLETSAVLRKYDVDVKVDNGVATRRPV